MKKRSLFAMMAVALMVSCGGADKKSNDTAQGDAAEHGVEQQTTTSVADDTLQTPTNSPVVEGDVVYLDVVYLFANSKLYLSEGVALETKLADFQKRGQSAQVSWQKQEQNFVDQMQKVQEDYNKSMITGITAQQRQEEIERRVADYQASAKLEAEKLAKEELQLMEEQQVLDARFAKLVELAVKNINADGRYKMIIRQEMVVDASEQLNITSIVLAEVDKLYEEGVLD